MVKDKRSIGEVEGLAAHTRREERGVALGRGLNDLVFHGEEVSCIFSCYGVGMYSDALLFKECIGGAVLDDRLHQGITREICGIMNDVGRVVAFQHQHQFQVITQIVASKSKPSLKCLLCRATCHTSDESHFREVIEAYAVNGFCRRECGAAVNLQHSFPLEVVVLLGNLQCHRLTRHQQFKATVRGCSHRLSTTANGVTI